jgi:uncharacterized SAM-binding protein YcdF (DUF218 family)
MFLFLSKLLPTLVYPLGFASLLLLLSLFLVWKRPRAAAAAILTAFMVLWLSSNTVTTRWLVQSLEWQNIPSGPLPTADAIVVLGGATRPQVPPRPWVEVQEAGDRILYGAYLYKENKAPLLVLSGGWITWMGESSGQKGSEAAEMADIVEAMGVPSSAIVIEPDSKTTYENAVNVKPLLEDRGVRQILLVTSAVHMPRSMAIFKRLGIQAIAAPTDFLFTDPQYDSPAMLQKVALDLLPNPEYLFQTTRALKEYIGIAVYRLKGWL